MGVLCRVSRVSTCFVLTSITLLTLNVVRLGTMLSFEYSGKESCMKIVDFWLHRKVAFSDKIIMPQLLSLIEPFTQNMDQHQGTTMKALQQIK